MRCFAIEALAMFATGVLAGICIDRIIIFSENESEPQPTEPEAHKLHRTRSVSLQDGKLIFDLKRRSHD